jgi:tetratricopeptide (TPR) repeat protein
MRWTVVIIPLTVSCALKAALTCVLGCVITGVLSGVAQAQQSPAQIAKIAPQRCAEPIARIASVQGLVELRSLAASTWQRAQLDDALCLNDNIRVGPHSRASVQYSADITVQFDQNSFVTLLEAKDKVSIWTQMWRGALHFITRSRKPFRVITPFVNASVEGTEVYIALAKDRADLTVFEGKLDVANDAGQVLLSSGESATVQGLEAITDDDQFRTLKAQAPQRVLIAKPRDAVQWALYYPPVIDVRPGENVHPSLKAATEQFRAGNTAEAFAELDRVPVDNWDAQYFIYRASLLLYVGREQEAQADLAQALQQDAKKSDALALQAIIAVVQSDKEQGLSLAQRAVDADPSSAAAQIALSYAQQAIFKLEAALQSAEQAAKLDQSNALAYARIAELQLSQGDLDKALVAAKKATELNPNLARTQSILGFSYLTRIDTKNAKETFARAIQLDSADPLPHLGLGLAKIREGKLEEGRRDIEQAVILDPNNSLIRSYVGKAYYEEKRDELAGKQFEIAKQLDPRDPTPWFYDAILSQTDNTPITALERMTTSIALNESRAVYRSKLHVDDDNAARGSSLSGVYGELGFERLAISQGIGALGENPKNSSAHRELAIGYANLPRHDIVRVSEALQAQLRQPLSVIPVSPQITTDNLLILRDVGPSRLGTNEFNQLFNREGVRLQFDAVGGNRGILGDSFILSGLLSEFSYALSQLHYETDGFHENDQAKKDVLDLVLHAQPSPKTTIQLDLKNASFSKGQNFFPIDPQPFSQVKIDEDSASLRLTGRYDVDSTSDLLFTAIYEDKERPIATIPDNEIFTQLNARTRTAEAQYHRQMPRSSLLAGAGHTTEDSDFPIEEADVRVTSSNAYLYTTWDFGRPSVKAHLGLSADSLDIKNSLFNTPVRRKRLNPKLGLAWTLSPNTVVRAAAFSSVKRPLIGSQTIEPTQVVGFSQFFTGFDKLFGEPDGTISRRAGIAIDHKFPGATFAGIEMSARKVTVPFVPSALDFDWKERSGHVYAYKTFPLSLGGGSADAWQLAASAEWSYERIARPQILTGPEGIMRLTTNRMPLAIRLFSSSRGGRGLSVRLATEFVRQQGLFSQDVGNPEFARTDDAWITDASLDIRFAKRRGALSIGIKNLTDQNIDLVQVDPINPSVATRRLVFARFRILF